MPLPAPSPPAGNVLAGVVGRHFPKVPLDSQDRGKVHANAELAFPILNAGLAIGIVLLIIILILILILIIIILILILIITIPIFSFFADRWQLLLPAVSVMARAVSGR
jgi:hypothetical protein